MKVFILVLLMLSLLFPVAGNGNSAYTPYEADEFPQWAQNLRRGEIIFFGSLPITVTAVNLILPRFFQDDLPSSARIIATVSLSAAIAVADYIIGRVTSE